MSMKDASTTIDIVIVCFIVALLIVLGAQSIDKKQEQAMQRWNVTCDGVHITYDSPVPFSTEDICNAFEK